MEENNRKGPGVFYAVVGVATLVVAIIGATFAYFTASREDNTIGGSIAETGGLTLLVQPETDIEGKMVPLNVTAGDTTKDTVGQLKAALQATTPCLDDNENSACQIYKVTVKNVSKTSSITVQGSLDLTATGTKNLKWQLLDANYATSGAAPKYAKIVEQLNDQDEVTKNENAFGYLTVGGNSKTLAGATVLENGTERASHVMTPEKEDVYYLMVWLEETGAAQEDDDANGSFSGKVFFSAVDAQGNETGITASFAAAYQQEQQ